MARRIGSAVALAALVGVLAACGGTAGTVHHAAVPRQAETPGAEVFANAGCGTCHTLAAANATGTVGPNLDELRPSRSAVAAQVRRGGNGMPSFAKKLSASDIGALAEFVAGAAASEPVTGVIAFKPDRTTLGRCRSGDVVCYMQAFGNIAYREGPKVALAEFARDIATKPAVEQVCHPIAHAIGAASLLRLGGDLGKAFADGSSVCGSGYYHGLLQWKLARVAPGRVAGVARTVCAGVRRTSSFFVYYQCVHGLGHGLMLYTHDDLPAALRLCHALKDSFSSISCSGGVFMENQQPSFGGQSKWLNAKNLLYPCNIVAAVDKTYCYLMVTSQILPRDGFDWRETAAWCRRSERAFVPLCFQSLGRDASGASRETPAGIRKLCAMAGGGERDCIFGAVRDILNNQPGDLRAGTLCRSARASDRSYCLYGIGSMIGTQVARSAWRSECRKQAAEGGLGDCLRGAASTAQQRQ